MLEYRIEQTDILIIGAGMAGLRAAVEASSGGSQVLVLSKGISCSWGIGGFNAAAGENDSTKAYYQDILKSGCNLNDKALSMILAENSLKEVHFLEKMGMTFDRKEDGSYDLLQPLGCSVPRLVHRKSKTGTIAEHVFMKILRERKVEVRDGVTVVDLLSDGKKVYGALGIEQGEVVSYQAKAVILAAGGCGHLYPISTYPPGIEGDSYAMLIRAGAEMIDMEFMQFEPCCLIAPPELHGRGISTTMLSAGAKLRNANGEEFLPRYFNSTADIQKGELSRAIYAEIQACNGEPAEYDMTGLTLEEIDAHCIYSRQLQNHGYNPVEQPLKIMPAAHTFLGGAHVSPACRTSLTGLYAAGEAMGGLHGANRIGGCAGAETFVFGAIAGENAANDIKQLPLNPHTAGELTRMLLNKYSLSDTSDKEEVKKLQKELQDALMENLFLIRDEKGLAYTVDLSIETMKSVARISKKTPEELLEAIHVENAALLIHFIAKASMLRKESRGVFFRKDYPEENSAQFSVSFVMKRVENQIMISRVNRS